MSKSVLVSLEGEEAAVGYYDVIMPVDGVASHDGDFTAWAFEQARRIRALRSNDIDIQNIAEEIESLGKGEVSKLESLLTIVVLHLLKWDCQPTYRSRSWIDSIDEHRRRVVKHLRANPSLKAVLEQEIEEAFMAARFEAMKETGLGRTSFPLNNPYDFDTIMTRELKLDDPE